MSWKEAADILVDRGYVRDNDLTDENFNIDI